VTDVAGLVAAGPGSPPEKDIPMKKFAAAALVVAALVAPLSGVVDAKSANGKGNGNVGCTLADGTHYANPAAMLKAFATRDGHVQTTVTTYGFASVGDLIAQKCGA